jgi:excisionase family DNA binding protein
MEAKSPVYMAQEVANMFGVNVATVRKWAKDSQIPAIRTFGGHWRFPREEIDALWREQRDQASPWM